jgi:hypothetical protein
MMVANEMRNPLILKEGNSAMNFKNFLSVLANVGIDLTPEQRELPVKLFVSCPETFCERLREGGSNLAKGVKVTIYEDHILIAFDWDVN